MCLKLDSYSQDEKLHFVAKFILFSGLISTIIYSVTKFDEILGKSVTFAEWCIQKKGEDFYLIGLVFILGELLFFPRSILASGSGYVLRKAFGEMDTALMKGIPLVCLAAFVSTLIQFALGRYIFQDWARSIQTKYKVLGAMINQMETSFSTMTLIHMIPFVPMNFMSFTAGISVITFGNFTLACIGIIPGTSLFFVLGANFSELRTYIETWD